MGIVLKSHTGKCFDLSIDDNGNLIVSSEIRGKMREPNYHKPIQARSKHHIGDMYIHKKHKFIIRIVANGRHGGCRLVEVVKGEVPLVVQQRVQMWEAPYEYEGEPYVPASMEYTTCALSVCFEKLKAGQVLFG